MSRCHYFGCPCIVANNVYMCSPHMQYGVCNYINDCGKKCNDISYYFTYCYKHFYMDLRYIILFNEKVRVENQLCDTFEIKNIYMCYDKFSLKYKYKILPSLDKTLQYYELLLPRWLMMYHVFKHIYYHVAQDLFSNVAAYYIFL